MLKRFSITLACTAALLLTTTASGYARAADDGQEVRMPRAHGGAEAASTRVFEDSSYRVALPASWSAKATHDAMTYRSPWSDEALTVAVYRLKGAYLGEAHRVTVMTQYSQQRRKFEQRESGRHLRLSALRHERVGATLHMAYFGEDRQTKRRFANVMVSTPYTLQNFYYEAVGVTQTEFENRFKEIFGRIETREPGQVLVQR